MDLNKNDIEIRLEEKPTGELQNSIKNKLLTEEAAIIARKILIKRGASIPDAIPEEVLEENYKEKRRNSNRNFILTIIIVCCSAAYSYISGQLEPGNQEGLKQNIYITFFIIAAIWGWDILGKNK